MARRFEPQGKLLSMQSKELLRKEINIRLSRRLVLSLSVGLALGLLLSMGVIALFAKIVEDVVEGESRRFDQTILLWINEHSPVWIDGPMRVITALGYYWIVFPLLVIAVYAFYRKGRKISAALLAVSTLGGLVLTTTLKYLFQRSRPELFNSGYEASFYSFPSGHATAAVGFYGTLALLVAWRLKGFRRWAVAAVGVAVILLIGFSRLYLGVHYPTDVIAGFLAAPLWVITVGFSYFLWRTFRRRSSGKIEGEN